MKKARISRKAAALALALAALLTLAACGASTNGVADQGYSAGAFSEAMDGDWGLYEYDDEMEAEATEEVSWGEDVSDVGNVPQKLVYTATAQLETKDIQAALEALYRRIDEAGGVIQAENLYNLDAGDVNEEYSYSRGQPSASLTVRVPSERYREFIAGLKADPDLIYAKSVTSETENLTRSYYDMESRVKALRSEEEWLLAFMGEAENVSEMLEIKDRLTEVQREIEALTTELKAIDYDADWSTAHIQLTQVQRYSAREGEKSFGDRVAGYFKSSGTTFLDFMEGLLEFIIMVLPYLILLGLLALLIWRIVKAATKRQRRKQPALFQPPAAPAVPAPTESAPAGPTPAETDERDS